MRRWVIGAAVVVVGIGVLTVAMALTRADTWITAHRAWIAEEVGRAIGRSVDFGDVGIRIFPRPAVRVATLRIGDDPDWSTEPFVTADAVDVSVAVLPALLGRLVVRRVSIERPVVTLIRERRGYNVRTLGRRRTGTSAPHTSPARAPRRAAPSDPTADGPETLPFALSAGRVHGGRVRIVDRRAVPERVIELEQIDATVHDLVADASATIEGRAALPGSSGPNATLGGTIGPIDLDALVDMPIDVEVEAADVDVARLRAALAEIATALPAPLGVTGPLSLRARVTGTAAAPGFDVRMDATGATITWAEWFRKAPSSAVVVTGQGRRAGDGAHLDRLELALFDDMVVRVAGDASPERVALDVDMAPTRLEPLVRLVPALDEPWAIVGALGLDLRVQGAVSEGRMPALTGTATLRDVGATSADRRVSVTGVTQTVTFADDHATLPATTLEVNGQRVVVGGRLGPFGGSTIGLTDLDVRIFDGEVTGHVDLDRTTPTAPRVGCDLRLAGIDVTKAVAMRDPRAARNVAGRASGVVHLRGRGTNPATIRPTLNGDGRLDVQDGALRGANLTDLVLTAVTKIPGLGAVLSDSVRRRHPGVFGGNDTHFDEMSVTWRIERGVVHVVRAVLSARDYTVEGAGTLDLGGRLDGTAVLRLAPSVSGDLAKGSGLGRVLRGAGDRVAIPFSITGTWPKVRVVPDVVGAAGALPGAVVPDAVEKGVGRLLDGLFNR